MKAIILSNNKLEDTSEYIKPSITSATQILIRIKATSLNPIDLQMFEGKQEAKSLTSNILGRELSGIVEEAGEHAKKFKVGDEVFAAVLSMGSNGAFAEYVVVDEEIVAHKPSNITFEQAATLPVPYVTAWQVVRRLIRPKKSSIFILGGSGSVGKALINLLTHFGYKNIYVTAGNPISTAQLAKQGLSEKNIISYRSDNLAEKIITTNQNKQYDIVIDCVGNKMTEIGAEVLKREGVYIDITNMKTANASYMLFRKAALIMNIARYSDPELFYKYGKTLKRLSELIVKKNWHLQEYHNIGELTAKNLLSAFDLMKANKTQGRKLVLSIT